MNSAAEHGLKHGAIGYLNTDWGDGGHWQYLPVSYLGIAAGAAYAWSGVATRGLDLVRALDLHVFRDASGTMGRLVYDLGNAYAHVGHLRSNGSLLSDLLQQGPAFTVPAGITSKTLAATRTFIDRTMAALPRARLARPDAVLVNDEFENAARMMRHACDRALLLRDPKAAKPEFIRRLATDMRVILGEHRRLWMARNRVGGLQDSTQALEQRLEEYESASF